jgi:molybdate transport system substrate-binding protein
MSRRPGAVPSSVWATVTALWVAMVVAACSSTGTPAASSPNGAAASSPSGTEGGITVFAAASLKKTFTELGDTFESENPGSTVSFNFAGSSDLVTQLIGGAPADVFASADTANMTKATDAGVVAGQPVNFATNTLTIITKPGNPKGIGSFADLNKAGVDVVVCAPQVPCGSAAEKIEAAAGVTLKPVSEENSVTDVLNKVVNGDADAGLVYVTDASAAGDAVTAVGFPESTKVVNTYPIATLTGAAQPASATKFVGLVTGPEGQQVLAAAGFKPAP